MALGDVIARLSVSLGLETAAFEKGSRRAQQEVTGLQGQMTKAARAISVAFAGMASIDALQAFRQMTREAVNTVGSLGEVAQQLGVTTDALQEFRYVASQTGIEEGEIDKALQRLTRTLGELREPTKQQAAALAKLGLTAKDLVGLDASAALSVFADAFNKLPDAAARSAVGFDLMGRSFQTLLPLLAEGSKGIQEMIAQAREAGIILTRQEIEQADQAADAIEAIDRKVAARQASMLARNGDTLVKFETIWGEAKIKVIGHIVKIAEAFDTLVNGSWWERLGVLANASSAAMLGIPKAASEMAAKVGQWVREMVLSIANWLGAQLDKVWTNVENKIRAVGATFQWLYDVVVGHSYIPDMVDGIAAQMQRLDAAMVQPVTAATSKSAQAFRDMAGEVQGLLDRLFPEVRRLLDYRRDLALIEQSGLSDSEQAEARRRLGIEFGGGGMSVTSELDAPLLTDGMSDVGDSIKKLTEDAEVGTVKIAKSFADMATETLQSLGRLTQAIKGGGFLDILTAVVDLGLQLGQSGAFGKGVQNFLNTTPKYAGGTNFHPGGMALVGERGPELVSMPRGSKVIPNGKFGGDVYHIQGNLLTPEFWQQIQSGDVAAARAGALGGEARVAFRRSRSLA